ncbi:MAG: hypothetical protein ACT4P7_09590 [Gemmatimonadaceae bacterium]
MSSHLLLALGFVVLPATAGALRLPADTLLNSSGTPDSVRVQSALIRADEATFNGRTAEARRIYRGLINEQRAADQFAGTAMWRLALNYLYADEHRRAAETLDDLADAAVRYGDPSLQLRATFEAAVLWKALKRSDLMLERLDRAKALLQSPAIPNSEKTLIKARMG